MIDPFGFPSVYKKRVFPVSYKTGEHIYSSTIDPIDNLYSKYSYYTSEEKLPIVILMHGYTQSANSITSQIMEDMAQYGFFAVAVGMRGRNGADGLPDVSGRELYDIYDCVQSIKAQFSDVVDANSVHVSGYSGGGGNVIGLASKFPDTFQNYVSHFGISDYGYDEQVGWWYTHRTRQSSLSNWIGHTPDSNNGAYMSRAHWLGIPTNLQQGMLWLFHDSEDSSVYVSQSEKVAAEMGKVNNNNYYLSVTTPTDEVRWLHDSPHLDSPVRDTRNYWGEAILNNDYPSAQISQTGSVIVQGYIVTKRFEIWLGNGQEHVAELDYDTLNDSYTVTPLTGSVEVTITQGAKGIAQTISGITTLVVS